MAFFLKCPIPVLIKYQLRFYKTKSTVENVSIYILSTDFNVRIFYLISDKNIYSEFKLNLNRLFSFTSYGFKY